MILEYRIHSHQWRSVQSAWTRRMGLKIPRVTQSHWEMWWNRRSGYPVASSCRFRRANHAYSRTRRLRSRWFSYTYDPRGLRTRLVTKSRMFRHNRRFWAQFCEDLARHDVDGKPQIAAYNSVQEPDRFLQEPVTWWKAAIDRAGSTEHDRLAKAVSEMGAGLRFEPYRAVFDSESDMVLFILRWS